MRATADLVNHLERSIRSKTYGQVRSLHVHFSERSIVLQGRTTTYYVKQLAQHAVTAAAPELEVNNAIEVC